MEQGLLITAIGMGLVFLMIVALWGIMAGMVAIFKEKNKSEEQEDTISMAEETEDRSVYSAQKTEVELAAAVGVAIGLASQGGGSIQGSAPSTLTTKWNPSTKAYQPFREHKGW